MTPETMILPDGSEITAIHYLVQPCHGRAFLACMPGLESMSQDKQRGHPLLRTEEYRSANCPMCKASADYKQAAANGAAARLEVRA